MLKTKPILLAAIVIAPISAEATYSTFSWDFRSSTSSGTNSSYCIDSSGNANTSCSGIDNNGITSGASVDNQSFKSVEGGTDSSVNTRAFSTTGDQINSNNALEKFESANLDMNQWGLIAYSAEDTGSGGSHAFDNNSYGGTFNPSGSSNDEYANTNEAPSGDVDAGLFKFDQEISLQSISLGWTGADADISVWAYLPTGTQNMANPSDITSNTFNDLLTKGWQWIGNYDLNLNTAGEVNPPVTSDISTVQNSNLTPTVYSSYWLISAYTPCAQNGAQFNGSSYTCSGSSGLNFGDDYFKIAGLGGKTTDSCTGGSCGGGSVPEPTSLILLSSGLLGWRLNRYGKTQANSIQSLAA